MPIDPDAQRVLDLIAESARPPYETLAVAEARRLYLASRSVLQPDPPEVAEVRETRMPGPAGELRLRLYRGAGTAASATLPCLLYYHGGGWVIGDLDSHDGVCRRIANGALCRVVSLDYRLGPEERFPAAVEDAAAALDWLARSATSLGIDAARVAVGGDSAGGNLAAVASLMARDGELPMPCFQLLIYPATDLTATHASYARVMEGFPLTTRTVKWFRGHYLRDARDELDWRASPLRAASLAGTPPAFVLTAGHDPLADEGIDYARRLDREGVRACHMHFADQMHGFLTMGRIIRATEVALEAISAALRRAWLPA